MNVKVKGYSNSPISSKISLSIVSKNLFSAKWWIPFFVILSVNVDLSLNQIKTYHYLFNFTSAEFLSINKDKI